VKIIEKGIDLKTENGFTPSMKTNVKQETKEQATAELIKVAHGVSMLYRFGSDRVCNTHDFIRHNAALLVDLETPEFHPETIKSFRQMAAEAV
jgi:hypothetical protein